MCNFYSFNLDYEFQERTNWCWCACLSWIVKKYDTSKTREQWQILRLYMTRINSNLALKDLTENEIITNDVYNQPLDLNIWDNVEQLIEILIGWEFEVEKVAELGNEKYKTISKLLSFENVKFILTSYNAPIMVSTSTHMFLISGFGANDCGNYILISDPFSDKGQRFFKSNIFLENYITEIHTVWILKNKHTNLAISNDEYMCRYITQQESLLKKTEGLSNLSNKISSLDVMLPMLHYNIWNLFIDYPGSNTTIFKNKIFEKIKRTLESDFCSFTIPRRSLISNLLFENIMESYFKGDSGLLELNGSINLLSNNSQTIELKILEDNGVLKGEINNSVQPFNSALQSILINKIN